MICADTPRRLNGLTDRRGGFALIGHQSLADEPELVTAFEHVVVLDPPATAEQEAITKLGVGYTYLAWGEPELRFAQQMHELEYGLRASLVAFTGACVIGKESKVRSSSACSKGTVSIPVPPGWRDGW